MASSADELRVTLSLWEKLTEEIPAPAGQNPLVLTATVQELRESVARHLEVLINTRHSELDLSPVFEECNSSVLAYGVIDFTTLVLSNPVDREKLRRSIERSVRQFEPRLSRIKVTLGDWDTSQTGLTLHILAELRVEPENEPVSFNAVLAKDSRRFSVSGGRL
jgi:type VI secretion system protein ImpF